MDKVKFPPPTATRCFVALPGAVVTVVVSVVVAAVSPCPAVEAIAVCVNNKAVEPEMEDAVMRMIMAAMMAKKFSRDKPMMMGRRREACEMRSGRI